MPKGEIIYPDSLNSIFNSFSLSYTQYVGFTGIYNDSILNKFIICMEKKSDEIGSNVLNQKEIDGLKRQKITGIKFVVLAHGVDEKQLLKYLLSFYPNANLLEQPKPAKFVKKEFDLLSKQTDELLCKIEYADIGNPNFIITILPISRDF